MQPKVVVAPDSNLDLITESINSDKDLRKIVQLAEFMEDVLEIEISTGSGENDNPCVILNVNGTNQPIWRGVPTPVKRKYVEVLARMKQTNYTQDPTNYIEPERSNALRPRTSQVYPFQVNHDPRGGAGLAWVRRIMAEAN